VTPSINVLLSGVSSSRSSFGPRRGNSRRRRLDDMVRGIYEIARGHTVMHSCGGRCPGEVADRSAARCSSPKANRYGGIAIPRGGGYEVSPPARGQKTNCRIWSWPIESETVRFSREFRRQFKGQVIGSRAPIGGYLGVNRLRGNLSESDRKASQFALTPGGYGWHLPSELPNPDSAAPGMTKGQPSRAFSISERADSNTTSPSWYEESRPDQ